MENLIALVTLTAREIVLGIDNIVFVSILAGRLPTASRPKARRLGLGLAMGMRILLLLVLSWIMGLTRPLFAVLSHDVSGRDLILILGGLFLVAKATHEIHQKLEGPEGELAMAGGTATYRSVILQILALDIVFSLDSVITAVGMARSVVVMIAAIVIAVGVMMVFAGAVSDFIERHPTTKMLALSFLLLIGVVLLADGLGRHIEKGYVYFAMAFSFGVELLNLRMRKAPKPVHLHSPTGE
ncbi:MAG: TerC family protein [Deltaproteobacteria bacterium]|nr:TerC family protein [Deltaproteobacteria bacterium]